jgi:hypothetical protein
MPEDRGTGVYVYGVVGVPSPPLPRVTGAGGSALELVSHGDLAAVVTARSDEGVSRRDELLSHSAVLNAVARQQDVAPMRFGTVMPDRETLVQELLVEQAPRLLRLLARLDGAVQLNLRATYVEERVLAEVVRDYPEIRSLRERTRSLPPDLPHPDALRLGRLVAIALDDRKRVDSQVIADVVLPMAREVRTRDRSDPNHVLDLALLVDRETVDLVEEELERLAEDVHERIQMTLSEPWAPFDFVEEEAWV